MKKEKEEKEEKGGENDDLGGMCFVFAFLVSNIKGEASEANQGGQPSNLFSHFDLHSQS